MSAAPDLNSLGTPQKTVKRTNKPNRNTLELWQAIREIVNDPAYDDVTLTTRTVYYQCVTRGALPANNDAQYNRVQRAVLQMRRQGAIPWGRIRDGVRERYTWAGQMHNDVAEALHATAALYMRNVMRRQETHVELWIEKDSLVGFLAPIARRYGVPFAALRGFSSDGFQYDAAEDWRRRGKHVVVIYAGDFDPSGREIAESLQANLAYFYPRVFVRHIGLHRHQVHDLRLPPSFTAKESDSRAPAFVKRYGSSCTELDAVPPDILKQWYEDELRRFVDTSEIEREWEQEERERQQLAELAARGLPGDLR
jgi:hypothetical protein